MFVSIKMHLLCKQVSKALFTTIKTSINRTSRNIYTIITSKRPLLLRVLHKDGRMTEPTHQLQIKIGENVQHRLHSAVTIKILSYHAQRWFSDFNVP